MGIRLPPDTRTWLQRYESSHVIPMVRIFPGSALRVGAGSPPLDARNLQPRVTAPPPIRRPVDAAPPRRSHEITHTSIICSSLLGRTAPTACSRAMIMARRNSALLAVALVCCVAPTAHAGLVKVIATNCSGFAEAQTALKQAYETAKTSAPITLKLELACTGGRAGQAHLSASRAPHTRCCAFASLG